MDIGVLKVFGQVAGLAGLCLGVLLLIFRDIVRKNIFPGLTRDHGYQLLRLIIVLVWSLALIGLATWAYSTLRTPRFDESVALDHSAAVEPRTKPKESSIPPAPTRINPITIKPGNSAPAHHKVEKLAQPVGRHRSPTWLVGKWVLSTHSVANNACQMTSDEHWSLEASQQGGQLVGTIRRHRKQEFPYDVSRECSNDLPSGYSQSWASYKVRFSVGSEEGATSYDGILENGGAEGGSMVYISRAQTLHGTVRRVTDLKLFLGAEDNNDYNVTLERKSW